MRLDRAYIRLQSGRKLDLLDPQPTAWTDADLAVGLSRTYRWGGHSVWDLPLSVAQHMRWSPFFGQAVKLGLPDEKDGPDDGQAEAVWG